MNHALRSLATLTLLALSSAAIADEDKLHGQRADYVMTKAH